MIFKRVFLIFLCCTLFLVLCSCKIEEKGESLNAFVNRMNNKYDYNMELEGFIVDESNNTFTKFFKLTTNDIMLQFSYDKTTNNLISLHIVFDTITKNNTEEILFFESTIYEFINNDAVAEELLEKLHFPDALYIKDINTKKEKVDNAEILIDVTDIGTVISVVKNNP